MNDRVVDRAAAHATPAELALRDWLLVGLSLATGMYEAICARSSCTSSCGSGRPRKPMPP